MTTLEELKAITNGGLRFDKEMCVEFGIFFSLIGQQRRVPNSLLYIPGDVAVGQTKTDIQLFSKFCTEIENIKTIQSKIKRIIDGFAAPLDVLAAGWSLIAIDRQTLNSGEEFYGSLLVEMYDEVKLHLLKRARQIEKFVENYPQIYGEAKLSSGSLFVESNYLKPEQVRDNPELLRSKFGVRIIIRPFAQSEDWLSNISDRMAVDQTKQLNYDRERMRLQVRQQSSGTIGKTLTELIDKIERQGVIQDRGIESIREWLRKYPAWDLFNDEYLREELVDRFASLIADTSGKELRSESKKMKVEKYYRPAMLDELETLRSIAVDLEDNARRELNQVEKQATSSLDELEEEGRRYGVI